jgi:hypothetical protein
MSSCNNLSRTIVGDSLAPDKSQVRWPTRPTYAAWPPHAPFSFFPEAQSQEEEFGLCARKG